MIRHAAGARAKGRAKVSANTARTAALAAAPAAGRNADLVADLDSALSSKDEPSVKLQAIQDFITAVQRRKAEASQPAAQTQSPLPAAQAESPQPAVQVKSPPRSLPPCSSHYEPGVVCWLGDEPPPVWIPVGEGTAYVPADVRHASITLTQPFHPTTGTENREIANTVAAEHRPS